jgi:DNA-binding response OmpR family regulator
LVVEGERHIATFLEFVLKRAGYEVVLAYDGEQALVAAEPFEPEAVILDLGLSGMPGLQVLKRLRTISRRTKPVVVVLSSRALGDLPAELIEAGAKAACPKAMAPSAILQQLLELGVPPTVSEPL